jgi:hypothetical protein
MLPTSIRPGPLAPRLSANAIATALAGCAPALGFMPAVGELGGGMTLHAICQH